ncbi:hypothetical protein WN944_016129 [Citrus x changshan-huyou]|uniref:Uncharacterized protein n=1 Tax=Citrus x changshan-huyou TaxID=2935761 RepID=A0AAP0QN95_9ROSI
MANRAHHLTPSSAHSNRSDEHEAIAIGHFPLSCYTHQPSRNGHSRTTRRPEFDRQSSNKQLHQQQHQRLTNPGAANLSQLTTLMSLLSLARD